MLTLISLQHVEILKVLRAIQEAIPPQVLLQKPVMFLDALGRLAPIHLDWINSYEAFLAVLKVRFKHHGLHLIEEKCFVLQATRTKRDVNFNLPWDCCLIPGQEYDMSMIFQHPGAATEAICVSCHHACAGQAGNDVTWLVTTLRWRLKMRLIMCLTARTAALHSAE